MSEEVKNQTPEPEQTADAQNDQEPEVAKAAQEDLDEVVDKLEKGEDEVEDDISKEIGEAAKKQQEMKDQMLRLQADFDNFKKRAQKERTEVANYTMETFMTKLLPVLDNLERAEQSAKDNLESYKQGVDMVFKQLIDVLKGEGLKQVETDGQKFDPNYHHGVALDSNPDKEDQEITETLQKGYQYKDKVIRPAMVKVNQK